MEDLEVAGNPPEEFDMPWVKVTESSENISGEVQSSKYINGAHGEYDLTKGHFYCFDPYPDAKSAEEQA